MVTGTICPRKLCQACKFATYGVCHILSNVFEENTARLQICTNKIALNLCLQKNKRKTKYMYILEKIVYFTMVYGT